MNRSKLYLTASAVRGSPSWNFTFSRSLNVHSMPSSEKDHDLARWGMSSVEVALVETSGSMISRYTRTE